MKVDVGFALHVDATRKVAIFYNRGMYASSDSVDDSGLDVGARALMAMTLHQVRTNPRIVP